MDGLDQNLGDLLDRPDFKEWRGGRRGGGSGAGYGLGAGGGYGAFFGMNGQAPTASGAMGMRRTKRQIGFSPMAGPTQNSQPTRGSDGSGVPSRFSGALDAGQAFGGEGVAGGSAPVSLLPSGLTAEQEQMLSQIPNVYGMRDKTRQRLIEANKRNGVGAGSVTQGDDWGRWINNTDQGWGGIQGRILGRFGEFGTFDPEGSAALTRASRERVMADSGARQAQARTAAALSGGDRSSGGVAELLATLGTASDASRAGSDAQLAQMMDQREFGQNLINQFFGLHSGNFMQQQAPRQQQGSTWQDYLGQLGGLGLGAWLGRKG